MIENLKELKSILRYEKTLYPNRLYDYLTLNQRVYNWRFVRALRWAELFHSKMKSTKNPFYGLLYLAVCRKKNRIGIKIGIEIDVNTFAPGLLIHHNGNIVINNGAIIGRDCQLHGDNCIGNRGNFQKDGFPIIGNNVDIVVGAKIIGPVRIADDIRIGANAVVVNSFDEPGITIVGVPAHAVRRHI